MTLPTPQYPLVDACSTLFNNTLYTYTSEAFQSLPLTKGASWSELPMGVAVTGGVCVKSTPKNNTDAAALYIVGGTSNSTDYPGLQRFTFSDGAWETIRPTVPVTQNRLWHNAVYLNTSDTILVYAGSQDGSQHPSSQTFTIQASEPYTVLAYEAIAPPAISPLLMQWTESKAIFIGGSDTNTKAMVFSPSLSWVDSNATLAAPLYSTSAVKAVVINGDDGSKNLYTFDMSVSPNGVNRTILIDADGNPVQNAKPIVEARHELDERSAQLMERGNLTVADWPTYNDTFAPSSTRTSYTICADQSGLVLISGGNEDDVLCMFKARDNCWANATAVLGSKAATVQGIGANPTTTTSSASQSATSTGTASTGDSPFPVKILGAVLGSTVLVAIILIALLALFRWRKKRRQFNDAGHQRRSSGIPDEKDSMDFADKGYPQVSSARQYLGHEPQSSQGSFSSMAILMGRYGHKRGGDKGSGSLGSDSSSQFNKKYKTAISKPIPQEQPMAMRAGPAREEKGVSFAAADEPAPTPKPRGSTRGGRRGSTRRSSGWNRYWSGGSAMNILGFGSKRTTYEGSDRSSDSQYSEQRLPSQITQVSAVPMPLKLGDRPPELNRVMSGSPTIAYQSNNFPLTREMSGTIERPGSMSTLSSFNDDRNDAFSSGVPTSVHEQNAWTPFDKPAWGSRPAPSNYSESVYATTLHQSTAPNLPLPQPPQRQPAQQSSDMSWLNLGGNTRI
ncbi:hypothetical protein N431DRAFT_321748 [Stipitochalara longipes BDJ]|nr:hypothetical protein N431DRAFT_321748 [Stipitochalara longipes BDJ]